MYGGRVWTYGLFSSLSEHCPLGQINSPPSVDVTIESPQYSSDSGSGNDASASPSAYSAANAALVRAPSNRTRGEIRELNSYLADTRDATVQIGFGEVITIRVPAYPSGTRIVWEFATDDYDIEFCLFFEWSKSPVSIAAAYSTSKKGTGIRTII
ncbi:hypothetical protein FBUS_09128 [Fasciolopsis buskii]|uniref:GOLD domain-containing protein n=1 Tax=Fasciolopsis buskii TaxID=27845 RepID=A0A8E0VQN3_9TREM|nr:hypothetical protein FBUS_09128 [Fasciolopsis buski]